ncbi:MAG TPA: hypothetical protein VE690_24175 [Rhodopila sp.]|nr:hypothetical protein [Rhodopila sp.]
MTRLFGRLACVLAFSLVPGLIVTSPALAQFGGVGSIPGAGSMATGQRAQQKEAPKVAEPEAVPGVKPRAPAAPSMHAVGELSPNDALFDAINRGDIVAARDALNRGADLSAVNVLGMTPMELSVDLGRNDISFLLLSMRGEDSGRGSRAVARGEQAASAAPAKAAAAKATAPARTGGERANGGRRGSAQVVQAEKPVPAPKLFANDGGTPLPSAGFLGFGGRQAAN